MNTPPDPLEREIGTARGSPRLGTWGQVLLLAAVVLLNLACVTMGVSVQVIHQKGQEDHVSITMSRHMTDEYIEAARQANTDREADYLAAGQPAPDSGFFDTMEQARALLLIDQEQLQSDGYTIAEDDRGFTAAAEYTVVEFLEKQDPDSTMILQVDRERPEGVYYILEIALPEIEDDLEKLDQLRQEGLGPKPPLAPIDEGQIEEGSISEGLTAILGSAGLENNQLDLWYAQRILLEAGLPRNEYTVELPGKIIVHEVSGVPTGLVEGNRVTLVFDEAFMREFGPGEHRFRVESLLSVCQETCAEQPHMTWDNVSEYPACSCICEQGWEMTAEGCVDCMTLCSQQDPPMMYDPENSEANRCACRPLPDQDGDGIPDERDKCPDQAAAAEDGCPEPGVSKPSTGGEETTPPISKVETFLTGGRTKGPSAAQAAGAGATLAGMAYLWWILFRADAADRRWEEEYELLHPPKPPAAPVKAPQKEPLPTERAEPPTKEPPPTERVEPPPKESAAEPPAPAKPPATLPGERATPTPDKPPATLPEKPAPTEAESPFLPSADPQSLELLQTRFQETVDQRIKEGHFVMNRDGPRKAWNWTIGRLTNWAQGYTTGQCGEFAERGVDWSKDFVQEIFGEGAIVDYIHIGERSSRDPEGLVDRLDWLYQSNHAATRVILPTGESYILDYWEAVGERQGDPAGDAAHDAFFGGPRPRREVRLIPEKEWIEKWTAKIGESEAEVFNVNYAQEEFQKSLFICGSFEEACERFMRMSRSVRGSDLQAQTIINNWRKSRWYQ